MLQPNSLNLDTSRPNYLGLDDTYNPTMGGSNDLNEDLAIPTRKTTVTYDELRQKNRDEYAKNHSQNRPSSVPYYQQTTQPPPSPANSLGPLNPPNGSYNPTGPSDNDRRRAYSRTKGEEDAGVSTSGQGGPKNKYGMCELFLSSVSKHKYVLVLFQVMFGNKIHCIAMYGLLDHNCGRISNETQFAYTSVKKSVLLIVSFKYLTKMQKNQKSLFHFSTLIS